MKSDFLLFSDNMKGRYASDIIQNSVRFPNERRKAIFYVEINENENKSEHNV